MKSIQHLLIFILFPFIFISCSAKKDTVNYYFDAVDGNDKNTGTSPGKPFKSLSIIKKLALKPGDSVLLKSGSLFSEPLYISCKGATGRQVVVGKYGGEKKPHIKWNGTTTNSVHVFNSEYLVIRDLEISNKGKQPIDGLNGLLVELVNYGTAKDITIDNLFIHDVLGTINESDNGGGNAILCRNNVDQKPDSVSSRFDTLVIQNCVIRNCQKDGIMMWGNWIRSKWNPSLHVIIRNNLIDGVPGHAIVPVACESPVVEYNVAKNAPQLSPEIDGVDGIWPWSCDNAVVQYNVVSDMRSQWDAYGFDADYNCSNSLFQYNLSYNNGGGFLLVCNSGGWSEDWCIGNVGSVIKYNVSINDGHRDYIGKNSSKYFSPVIHCTGSIKNSVIEKNLIYVPKKKDPQVDKTILHLDNWGKENFPDSTFFRNNFIYAEEPNLAVNPENSTNHFFENNLYVGDLKAPANGFARHNGSFDKSMWYDARDSNWNKLVEFLKDKKVPVDGTEVPVLDIIGFNK